MKKLVLDLDETLLFSSNEAYSPSCVELSAEGIPFFTSFRPGTHQFLEFVSKRFECWIWSTGHQSYIESIWAYLGIPGFTLWGREFCVKTDRTDVEPYEKPLRKISTDLTQVVIADNTPSVFAKTPQNGILTRTWHGDPNDVELEHLSYYLDWLSHQDSMQRDHSRWRIETLYLRSLRGIC